MSVLPLITQLLSAMPRPISRALILLAYWVLVAEVWVTGRHRQSAAVAVWYEGRLLLVRNSYRPDLALPGGILRRGETPLEGAVRELREEVGIAACAGELRFFMRNRQQHLFDLYLDRAPEIKPDQLEVIGAEFFHVDDARKHPNLHRFFRLRRAAGKGATPFSA